MNLSTKSLHWQNWLFRGSFYLPTPVVNFHESEQLISILIPWTGQEHLQSVQSVLTDEIQRINLVQDEQTTLHAAITFGTTIESKLFQIVQNVSELVYKNWNKEKLQCCVELLLFHWHPQQLAWVNASGIQIYGCSKGTSEVISSSSHFVSSKFKKDLPYVFLGEGSFQNYQAGCTQFFDWKSLYFLQGSSLPLVLQRPIQIQGSQEYQKIIEVSSLLPFWLGSLSQDTSIEGDVVGNIQK
jgi:hypothetical protein